MKGTGALQWNGRDTDGRRVNGALGRREEGDDRYSLNCGGGNAFYEFLFINGRGKGTSCSNSRGWSVLQEERKKMRSQRLREKKHELN